ncbi:hypothetical protein [Vibrio phage TCU-VP03-AIR1]
MEFLLVLAPVVGVFVSLLLILLVAFILSKIFKFDLKLPYGKIIAVALVLTLAAGAFKVFTSPITRPTATEVVNDTAKYKVDPMTTVEAPKMVDKSFKAEEVDVTTLNSEERIKSHNATN